MTMSVSIAAGSIHASIAAQYPNGNAAMVAAATARLAIAFGAGTFNNVTVATRGGNPMDPNQNTPAFYTIGATFPGAAPTTAAFKLALM